MFAALALHDLVKAWLHIDDTRQPNVTCTPAPTASTGSPQNATATRHGANGYLNPPSSPTSPSSLATSMLCAATSGLDMSRYTPEQWAQAQADFDAAAASRTVWLAELRADAEAASDAVAALADVHARRAARAVAEADDPVQRHLATELAAQAAGPPDDTHHYTWTQGRNVSGPAMGWIRTDETKQRDRNAWFIFGAALIVIAIAAAWIKNQPPTGPCVDIADRATCAQIADPVEDNYP